MSDRLPSSAKRICIHTGNILNLNEVKKKAGQNPTDELVESLKITLNQWDAKQAQGESVQILREDDDTKNSINSEDRKNLKIGVKAFISSPMEEILYDALETMYSSLNVDYIDSLVVAYPSKAESTILLPELQSIWILLESYYNNNKIGALGVSDVDTDVFVALHNWAKVKPSIIQINLASCCVVPPALQEFTKQNDVQLLTHSDPFEILPKSSLSSLFPTFSAEGEEVSLNMCWALRYQVHVKCRGVLASKGYVVSVCKL